MKKIVITQSNYIPWKGYFDLINMADEFVYYDDVQYTKLDWRNRNKIKTAQGEEWLTIPVSKHSYEIKINEATVAGNDWARKHWFKLQNAYAKAKYFKEYKKYFEEIYMNINHQYLCDVNYEFIKAVNSILNITTPIHKSTDFVTVSGKTERLVDLCKQLKATEYLCGPAAKVYLDETLFNREGMIVTWMDYSGYQEYGQLYPPFVHGVSILDLIFNEGPNATQYMKSFN